MKFTTGVINQRGDRQIIYFDQKLVVEAADWKEFQKAVSEADQTPTPKEKTMNEQFSTTVDLDELQRALVLFELETTVTSPEGEKVSVQAPVKVQLTIDDHAALTITPCAPKPITIEGEA